MTKLKDIAQERMIELDKILTKKQNELNEYEKTGDFRYRTLNSRENFSEQLQMLIFLKVFAFMSVSLAVLHLANSNLWKEVQKSSH